MMDENFEVNELEFNDNPQIPPADPVPADPQPEEPAASPAPVRKRRRKRKKRPTWQRLLWKYWPPIRFGLILLAGVLLIWLLFSSVGAIFSSTDEPTPTDPPQESQNTEPPATEAPTQAPTLPPTEPPTAAPTDPPDPFAGAVAESWYDNTLFIGDFNMGGLRDVARSGNADYFCTSNMGVFNWDEETADDEHFDKQTLLSLLGSKKYEKIIINLGINNCGYPTSSLINAYSGMVTSIRNAQPDAKIILHGIMLVTKNYADDRDYFSPDHIGNVNDQISELADGTQIFYIDVNESFAASSGYLLSSASTDGCHLTTAAYEDWAKLMGVQLGKLGIE